MLKDPDLQALDDEFNAPDSTMHVTAYVQRRKEIQSRGMLRGSAPAPVAAPTPAATPEPRPAPVAARAKPAMDAACRAEFESIEKKFREARAYGDADVMSAVIRDARFQRLAAVAAFDEARTVQVQFDLSSVLALVLAQQKFVRMSFETHIARERKFEARVAALEGRPAMAYRGVWKADENYRRGDLATHAGSMFHCWAPTKGRPGETDDWQLCVKRGTDGRDAR